MNIYLHYSKFGSNYWNEMLKSYSHIENRLSRAGDILLGVTSKLDLMVMDQVTNTPGYLSLCTRYISEN